MTTEEFNRETTKRVKAIERTEQTIVDYSRGLVAVLKDAGRANSAEELQAQIFLLDAQRQELEKHMAENSSALAAWLKEQARRYS